MRLLGCMCYWDHHHNSQCVCTQLPLVRAPDLFLLFIDKLIEKAIMIRNHHLDICLSHLALNTNKKDGWMDGCMGDSQSYVLSNITCISVISGQCWDDTDRLCAMVSNLVYHWKGFCFIGASTRKCQGSYWGTKWEAGPRSAVGRAPDS